MRGPFLLVLVGAGLATLVAAAAAAGGSPADGGAAPPPSSRPRTVLLTGDSMVGFRGGLAYALGQRFAPEGVRLHPDPWNRVSIATYDRDPHLRDTLRRVNPDVVFVVLGANDLFVPHPEALAGNIRSIVRTLEGRPCVWIGPPPWKPDAGIVDVLSRNVAPCRFFDSRGIEVERIQDGIHPSDKGGADWAQHLWPVLTPVVWPGRTLDPAKPPAP